MDANRVIENGTVSSGPSAAERDSGRYRAMVYSILAQALFAPSPELCEAVEQGVLSNLVRHALDHLPTSYARELDASFLDKLHPKPGIRSFADAIMAEYTRLFGLNLQCPQYEADYLGRNSFNSAHVIAAVTSMYSSFGVQLAAGVGERPDHIAVQLDFMNLLATKEAHAREMRQAGNIRLCRRAQKLFFSSHLSRWGTAFARNLGKEARLEFYQGMGGFVEAMIAAEARYLKVELGSPGPGPKIESLDDPSPQDADCGCSGKKQDRKELTQIVAGTSGPVQQVEPARRKE